jgi:hypothetical protein
MVDSVSKRLVAQRAPGEAVLVTPVKRALVLALLVVPCFWRPIVSPADLQSHLYNAWLAQLIQEGRAPGLRLVTQYTNVLVDWLLAPMVAHLGALWAQRLICALLVLIFFTGVMRFLREPAWAAPWVAILSYGFVFQYGFLNFYLATGLVFWALALGVWGAPLVALAVLAHPVPVAWLLGVLAYRFIAGRVQPKTQVLLCLLGIGAIAVLRIVLLANFRAVWGSRQFFYVAGADQALLYGNDYAWVSLAMLLLLVLLCVRKPSFGMDAQLYWLTAAVVALIPFEVGGGRLISQRLSLYAAILALNALRPPRWPRVALGLGLAAAALFFALLFRDMGTASRIERKLAQLVPSGGQVMAFLPDPPGHRVPFQHLISRACIGRCFDFANYEAATGQFRIRAQPGNPIAVSSYGAVHYMELGTYPRQPRDPPLDLVYRCGPQPDDLCLQALRVGERGVDVARPYP